MAFQGFQTNAFQQAAAGATTDVTGAAVGDVTVNFGTPTVTSTAVTNVSAAAVGDVAVNFGSATVTTTAVTNVTGQGFDNEVLYGDAVVTSEAVANVTAQGFDSEALFGTPDVTTEEVVAEEAGQTPAGRRRRWVVEVEGRDYFVDSAEEARALLEANRKVTPLPTKGKRTTRVVRLPEVRLEGMPPIKLDGVSVAQKIVQGVPDEVLRAALEALDEDDLEVILLAA